MVPPRDESLTLFQRRLDLVERDLRDHAKIFTSMTEAQQVTNGRLTALELSFRKWEISDARAEERGKRLDEKITRIDDELEGLKGIGTKLLWIVAGGVVTAFLAFVFKGGLVL